MYYNSCTFWYLLSLIKTPNPKQSRAKHSTKKKDEMLNSKSDSLRQLQAFFFFSFAIGVTAVFFWNAQGIFQLTAKSQSQEKQIEGCQKRLAARVTDLQLCSQKPVIRGTCRYNNCTSATRALWVCVNCNYKSMQFRK